MTLTVLLMRSKAAGRGALGAAQGPVVLLALVARREACDGADFIDDALQLPGAIHGDGLAPAPLSGRDHDVEGREGVDAELDHGPEADLALVGSEELQLRGEEVLREALHERQDRLRVGAPSGVVEDDDRDASSPCAVLHFVDEAHEGLLAPYPDEVPA